MILKSYIVEQDINKIKNALNRSGYYFATVDAKIIENNNDAVLSVEGNNMYVVQWALIFNKRHKLLEKSTYLDTKKN